MASSLVHLKGFDIIVANNCVMGSLRGIDGWSNLEMERNTISILLEVQQWTSSIPFSWC